MGQYYIYYDKTKLYLCYSIYNYPPTPSGGGLKGSSPSGSVTPLENSTPLNNPPSPVPTGQNDPDSDPDSKVLGSSLFDSSDSLYPKDGKLRKRTRKKRQSKNYLAKPIENCAKLTYKLLKAA